MSALNPSPHYCPECCWLTDEITISVNVSFTEVEDDGEIRYTGDTNYGDTLAPVGHVCPLCSTEWVDTDMLRRALTTPHLDNHPDLRIDRELIASQRQALEASNMDTEAKEGLLNLLDAL